MSYSMDHFDSMKGKVGSGTESAAEVPTIRVEPKLAVFDEEISIRLEGLAPASAVTVSAFLIQGKNSFQSHGQFVADHLGRVNVGEDVCLGGSWRGRLPMGLFTSMVNLPSKSAAGRFIASGPANQIFKFDIRCWRGHLDWNEVYTLHMPFAFFGTEPPVDAYYKAHFLAQAISERTYMGPGVKRVALEFEHQGSNFDCVLFFPATKGPYPAIIDLFGGIGGKVEFRAALWARHGYMAMAMAYVSTKTNPDFTDFTMEYFDKAIDWLYRHPRTDRSTGGIGMCGVSLGSQVTLLSAVRNPRVKAAILINGTAPMQCDPAISGNPWVHISAWPPELHAQGKGLREFGQFRLNNNGHHQRWEQPGPGPAPILKHTHDLRIFNIFGDEDELCFMRTNYENLKEQFERSGLGHQLSFYESPGTGHIIEPPYAPQAVVSAWKHASRHKDPYALVFDGTLQNWGGKVEQFERECVKCWRLMREFFQQSLAPGCPQPKL